MKSGWGIAVCEFCLNLTFEKDEHIVFYNKYIFHKKCFSAAKRVENWFVRFWEREAKCEKQEAPKK